MNNYVLIAGVNGTGKSSLRGVLEGQGVLLGHIIDADKIAKDNNYNNILAGKKAIEEINYCLKNNISFTQETTLSGHRIERTVKQARKQGYYITLYYVGLNSKEESILRIANRVRKGGHNIPENDVIRRFDNRIESLKSILPFCDNVIFYDNENGFVKVAEIIDNKFKFTNGYRTEWIEEFKSKLNLQG
ncbi:MAG: zeta toxin family protein [Ruminococcus sp.]|nr:zeta toxin family protein [Ruminococcus sp.]